MCKMDLAKCSNFFQIVFLIIFINVCASAPVNLTENAYTRFLAELNRDKCSIPSEVHLPFDTTKAKDFDYLSPYLELCQKTKSVKPNKEADVLCKEIFDNIRNISCSRHSSLPDISEDLSSNVCQDISLLKDSVPENDKSLLKRLTDVFLCGMMCDSEFEKACQVLLWSFKVQKRIASVASAQEPEQLPENEGVLNAEDSFKNGNAVDEDVAPEISVNPEKEKNTAGEAEDDGNKFVEESGIAEVPAPKNLEDNTGQNLVEIEKEKTIPNDTSAVVGNQTIPNAKSQNSTVPLSSTKLASTLLQTSPGVQTSKSDSEVTPVTGDSDGQNANKQLQSNKIKNDEANVENELPQGSNVNVAIGEVENQGVNTIPDETVHPLDNSNTNTADNKMTDGTPEKGDQSSNNHVLPHELGNDKNSNDAASGLFKVQNNVINEDKLGEKIDSLTTTSQAIKSKTQLQTETQPIAQDKIDITEKLKNDKTDETKADQLLTDSLTGKVETQNHTQTVTIDHSLVTDVKPSEQKPPEVAQQTEKPVPAIVETTAPSDGKLPEKSSSTSMIPESLPETSTKTTVALEQMEGANDHHQPADEEPDHYGDQENTEDEEYSKSDYGGGLYEVSKNKESNPDAASLITSPKETIAMNNGKQFPPRNPFGQDIQMISSFPEQEDSHFFFYFLSFVLILMAGYLIFHNKQKIIALIVEGRHERNRRSHRIGYKKLETK